jgi:hypothetical protein
VSAETLASVEKAIEAHLADENGDPSIILTGFILQAAGQGLSDDRTSIVYCGKPGQSGVVTLGLLAYMTYNAEGVTFDAAEEA